VAREKVHSQITDESQSALRRYQRLIVGSTRLGYTLKYDLIVAIGSLAPGALGLWLRQTLYRRLLMRAGRGVFFGAGVPCDTPARWRSAIMWSWPMAVCWTRAAIPIAAYAWATT